jgi:hypothetical protein
MINLLKLCISNTFGGMCAFRLLSQAVQLVDFCLLSRRFFGPLTSPIPFQTRHINTACQPREIALSFQACVPGISALLGFSSPRKSGSCLPYCAIVSEIPSSAKDFASTKSILEGFKQMSDAQLLCSVSALAQLIHPIITGLPGPSSGCRSASTTRMTGDRPRDGVLQPAKEARGLC